MRETSKKLLESLIQSQSIKKNAAGNQECLSLPREKHTSGKVDKKTEILILKEQFQNFTTELNEEFINMKKLYFAEAELLQYYDKDILVEPSQRLINSLEKQVLFLQEKLGNENKLIILLMHQLLKNSDTFFSPQQQLTYARQNNLTSEEMESTSATQSIIKSRKQ